MPKMSTANQIALVGVFLVGIAMGGTAIRAYGNLETRVLHVETEQRQLAPTVVELRIAVGKLTQAIESHVAADKVTE